MAVLSQICGYGYYHTPEGQQLWAVKHQVSVEQDYQSVTVNLSHNGFNPYQTGTCYYKVFLERKNAAGGFDRVDWKWATGLSGPGHRTVKFTNIHNNPGQTMRLRLEVWNGEKTQAIEFYNRYGLGIGNMYNTLTWARGAK